MSVCEPLDSQEPNLDLFLSKVNHILHVWCIQNVYKSIFNRIPNLIRSNSDIYLMAVINDFYCLRIKSLDCEKLLKLSKEILSRTYHILSVKSFL